MMYAWKTSGAGRKWPACTLALALAPSLLLSIACSDASRNPREPADQIVLIVIDTLRTDRLGIYGGPSDTAPFLSELAARSLVFDAAWAPSSWTGPSMASIFTSMYPNEHGVVLGLRGVRKAGELRKIDVQRIPDSLETIPVFMRSQGYTTFGVSSNINVGPIIGFDRGFDHFELILYRQTTGAPALVDALREWKDEIQAQDKSFIYLHFMDPHPPYIPHDSEHALDLGKKRSNLPLYDGEIRYADNAIRLLFSEFGWMRNAIVLITSDHGQEFGDHGGVGHGFQLYSELTRVPLLIHHPSDQPSGRVERNVTTLDVLPTLRQLLGAGAHEQDTGRSLLESSPAGREEREIFSMRTDARPEVPAQKRALIRGHYKLILSQPENEVELYDLRSDAGEQRNLAAAQPERVQAMRARLAAQAQSASLTLGAMQPAAMPYEPSREEAKQLESLGYIDDAR